MPDTAVSPNHARRSGEAVTCRAATYAEERKTDLPRLWSAPAPGAAVGATTLASEPSNPQAAGPFGEFLTRRRFASLDGLRAFGVLAVVWHHTVARGWGGVSLFFSLSGFLIATRLIRARRLGRLSVRDFYGRTARRILPLYFAVLALYFVMVLALERDQVARAQFFENLPAFATFTANWFVDLDHPRVIFYFVWSLSAQVQFYLLWPWIERGCRGAVAAGWALALLVVSQAIAVGAGDVAREHLWLRVLSGMPAGIMVGVLLAHALHAPRTFAVARRICGARGSGVVAVGVVLAVGWFPEWGGAWHDLLAAGSYALLIATCVLREDHDWARVLSGSVIARVGAVSYGIYLLHMLAVNVVRRGEAWGNVQSVYLEFALGAALAIGLALASHRFWERRFLRERAA